MGYQVFPTPVAPTPETMPVGATSKITSGVLANNPTARIYVTSGITGAYIQGDVALDYVGTSGFVSTVGSQTSPTFIPENGKFVTISQAAANLASFTSRTLPSSLSWSDITYGNDKFVAVAYGSQTFAYSSDGITWTTGSMPSSNNWYRVLYANGTFVAIVNGNNVAAYSSSGTSWTSATLPYSTAWTTLVYGAGKFLAIDYNSGHYATSTYGTSWTGGSTGGTAAATISAAYGNGVFLATKYSATNCVYSADGITWSTGGTIGSSGNWFTAFGNGVHVAVSQVGAAWSADGGRSWTAATGFVTNPMTRCIFANGQFIAISGNNSLSFQVSSDGKSWKTISTGLGSGYWSSICYGPDVNTFVAVQGYVHNYTSSTSNSYFTASVSNPTRKIPFGIYAGPTTTY